MTTNQVKTFVDQNNTFISIGLVVAVASVLVAFVWESATMSTKVATLTDNYKDLTMQFRDAPSRAEFNSLKNDVNDVKLGVDKLVNKLIIERNPY
jgi:hypothetical protein